jgi:hypothetical protein
MSFSLHVRGLLAVGCLVAASPRLVLAQAGFVPQAGEYAIAGSLPGDQVQPQIAVKASGGYVVWQDNITDGDGWGISARKLNSSFSGVLSNFRVNQQGAGDQQNARVSLLNDGGAAFIWQGGPQGFQRIYARFLSGGGTWTTGDVQVNTFTNDYQADPAICTLTNGNVVAAWGSFNEAAAGSLQDVYAQILTPAGQKIGGEIPVNQFTPYNQRNAALAALPNGGFVVTWVSEQERMANSVDVYARLFDANGAALSDEFLVNTSTNVCAQPSVAAAADGSFAIAWAERDLASIHTNSWDVYARVFTGAGAGGTVNRVNTYTYGDQFAPKISFAGGSYLEVWTSMGQDGSGMGVYGQFLNASGSPQGGEFRVNTTTASDQMEPAVAADGSSQFVAVWTSFTGFQYSFDLYAQRYASAAQPLPQPAAPYVVTLSSNSLSVTWPALAGYAVADYEVYADGVTNHAAAAVTNNWWTLTGLAAGSSHTFALDYVLTDGRRSPLSATASGTTWSGLNWGGIPFEWMSQYYGSDLSKWPPAATVLSPGGPTLLYVFLSGGNPLDSTTWLRTQLQPTAQGLFLSWNTQAGLVYQVQASTDTKVWANLGAPRFAAGTVDSLYVGAGSQGYYRVLRVR